MFRKLWAFLYIVTCGIMAAFSLSNDRLWIGIPVYLLWMYWAYEKIQLTTKSDVQ